MNQLATISNQSAAVMERVVADGDLSHLSPQQRLRYYLDTCKSVGLNPYTRPFDYIRLNNKLVLYAKRDCADQLRKLHGVNIQIMDKTIDGDLYIVTVRAVDKHGRTDEDMGAVVMGALKGEPRANAILKAVTKAKRRVTLSICGLGLIDETEAADAGAQMAPDAMPEITAAEAIGDSVEHIVSAPSRKQTQGEWLDALERDLGAAESREAVDAIISSDRVQKALDAFKNGAKDRLNAIIKAAIDRTTIEDAFPGDTPLPEGVTP